MAAPPSLPLEILICIVDEVSDPNKRPTLRALSLVSRTIRIEAQRALFSDPGRLCIGHKSHQHNSFIESIIASRDRLALLVRRYEQYTSWDASNQNSDAWSPVHSETTSFQQRLLTIGRVSDALRLMTNLKHLSFADSHTYYHGRPHSGAEMMLRGCKFQLHSFEWRRRDSLTVFLTDFLPMQKALRTLHLSNACEDLSNLPQALREVPTDVCLNLLSLSAPRLLSEVVLPGKRVQYLQWTPLAIETAGESVGNIRCVERELEHVKLLDFECNYAPPLASFVGYLISLEVLVVTIPRTGQELMTCLGQLRHLMNLRALVLQCGRGDEHVVVYASHITPLFTSCRNLQFVDIKNDNHPGFRHFTMSPAGELKAVAFSPCGAYHWERRVDFHRLSAF